MKGVTEARYTVDPRVHTFLLQRVWLILALVLSVTTWGASRARAQGVGDLPSEVDLQVDQFGLGNAARPGEWIGVQVTVADKSPRPRELSVRLGIKDGDGDVAQYQAVVPSTPGARVSRWLYVRLPFDAASSPTLTLSAVEDTAGAPSEAGAPRAAATGEVIGLARFTPQPGQLTPATTGLIAVVGRSVARLSDYAVSTSGYNAAPEGHEVIRLVEGLAPAALPDRWLGYSGFKAVIWTASASEGEPSQLSEAQAAALRQYVQRGGHLIVVLPSVGQQWTVPSNPLLDVMPRVQVARREDVSYAPLLTLLRRPLRPTDAPVPVPERAILHALTPDPQAAPIEAEVLMTTPDGAPVAVRRLVGGGAVTLIGLDLKNPGLALGAVQPDIFWHRLLGRRAEVISGQELAQRSSPSSMGQLRRNYTSRDEVFLDRAFDALINKEGAAAAGLLLAFVVFLAYWGVAGPLGFVVLKARKRSAWAWVAFVGAGAAFTALAWGGANLLKPRVVDARHLTFLDHVYGQNFQRARSWMSVLLPTYGSMTAAIVPEEGAVNALCAWSPASESVLQAAFPDSRTYAVSARDPSALNLPARSTVKTLQADWAGGPRWAMPVPTDASAAPAYRATPDALGSRGWSLSGQLTHQLPAPLQDITIIVVREPVPADSSVLPGQMLVQASAFALTKPWAPGDVLDLGTLTAGSTSGNDRDALSAFIRDRLVFSGERSGRPISWGGDELTRRMNALALFDMLDPPDTQTSSLSNIPPLYRREQTHGWDLSRWFTQPCIIILGHVREAPSPIPMTVDAEPLPSSGHTVVRWVYPLPTVPLRPSGRPGVGSSAGPGAG